ncbi:MAG TPA: hypothetical protein VGC76_18155 [Pyrinomonadaceae bacterium]|jgi:hypothetical protein
MKNRRNQVEYSSPIFPKKRESQSDATIQSPLMFRKIVVLFYGLAVFFVIDSEKGKQKSRRMWYDPSLSQAEIVFFHGSYGNFPQTIGKTRGKYFSPDIFLVNACRLSERKVISQAQIPASYESRTWL